MDILLLTCLAVFSLLWGVVHPLLSFFVCIGSKNSSLQGAPRIFWVIAIALTGPLASLIFGILYEKKRRWFYLYSWWGIFFVIAMVLALKLHPLNFQQIPGLEDIESLGIKV